MPVPLVEAFALPGQSKRATLKTPRQMIYTGMYNHYMGRSRCLVFNEQSELARFSSRQNQSVQKTPLSISSAKNHQRWFKAEAKIKKNINLKEKAIKKPPHKPYGSWGGKDSSDRNQASASDIASLLVESAFSGRSSEVRSSVFCSSTFSGDSSSS